MLSGVARRLLPPASPLPRLHHARPRCPALLPIAPRRSLPHPPTWQAEADRIGYPLLVKAVMGGGGKGMKLASAPGQFMVGVGGGDERGAAALQHKAMVGWLRSYNSAPVTVPPPPLRTRCTLRGARRRLRLATSGCCWSGSSRGRATSRCGWDSAGKASLPVSSKLAWRRRHSEPACPAVGMQVEGRTAGCAARDAASRRASPSVPPYTPFVTFPTVSNVFNCFHLFLFDRCKCLPMRTAMLSTCLSVTARCSGATRRCAGLLSRHPSLVSPP